MTGTGTGTVVEEATMSLDMRYFDRPIAFHRAFVSLGGVKVALFLSQALYWTNRLPADRGGWFWKTGEEWRDETGLTREEIDTVRKRLKALGVLEEKLTGVPAKLWYRVNASKLEERLQASVWEGHGPVCVKPTNCVVGNPQTITETTAETPSEITRGGGARVAPPPPAPVVDPCEPVAEYRAVGALPPGADTAAVQAWREYRMCGGPDRFEWYLESRRAAVAAGVPAREFDLWHLDNRGRKARDAHTALVPAPGRPRGGGEQDLSGILGRGAK